MRSLAPLISSDMESRKGSETSTKASEPLLGRRRPVRISADGWGDTDRSPDRYLDPGGCRGAVAAGLQGEALPGEARE